MDAHDYTIRIATPDDVSHLPAIERAAAAQFPAEVLPDHLRGYTVPQQELRDAQRDGRLWIAATIGGEVVGFAVAQDFDGVAYLQEIDVHPDHGRRGLGRALVEAVILWARARAFRAVLLDTFRNVPWNMPFYARIGFVEVDLRVMPVPVRAIMQRTFDNGLDPANRVAMEYRLD